MIHEAIVAIKDRTGSSIPALKKYILTEYPQLDGPHFKNRFNNGLKSGLKTERFDKGKYISTNDLWRRSIVCSMKKTNSPTSPSVRQSYKISSKYKEKQRAKKKKATRVKQAKKKALTAEERNKQRMDQLKRKELTPEELAKAKATLAAKAAAEKRREEQERAARERADRIKRRRFPMEDTRLHQEDKELHVRPPSDVTARPYLPYFWQITLPLDDPARKGKTSDSILRHSKVDNLDISSRGLVPDLLQVYHFFSGDVNFTNVTSISDDETLVAPFKLSHLIFATDEIIQGNAKRSRLIPPLISHLFVVSLQLLCQVPEPPSSDDKVELAAFHFRKELNKYLLPALNPASWPDICFLYMDAMERFYSVDVSIGPNSLPPMATDLSYLLGLTDQRSNDNETLPSLPEGYGAYLGDYRGALYKAHEKLGRQEAWLLTAEEIIALLRALSDDVLATYPDIVNDMNSREEEMQVLLKAKREAENKLRKVRLAFEGPKKKRTPAAAATTDKDGDKNDEAALATENNTESEPAFKPTATKKQFEAAQKAQLKAQNAYDKGIRRLVARTEPIGFDRDFNAIYRFSHDPEVIYVEDKRPPARVDDSIPPELQYDRRSWHVIETASAFDAYTSSLDIRGRREHDLYEELTGPSGPAHSLRRFLHNDVKDKSQAAAQLKEKEELLRKIEIAKIKCDEEKGRRSGRLADQAEIELVMLQDELANLEKQIQHPEIKEKEDRDYYNLTGIYVLEIFENAGRVATRRTREKKESIGRPIPLIRCSKMVPTGNIDGSGIVGLIVSNLLEIEERCQKLAPWDKKDVTQASWISRLEENVHSWHSINPLLLGPDHGQAVSLGSQTPDAKRQKKGPSDAMSPGPGTPSVSSIHTQLRQAVLDLENRVADLTNVTRATLDADIADDNMSVEDHDQQETAKLERAWKKLVYRLRDMPARRHVQIRETLVQAIAMARKAHLPDVVGELRAALLLYHPNAAKDCKDAAVAVLVKHGDYEPSEEDDDEDDLDGDDNAEEKEEEVSVLSAEAVTLRSCLGGTDDATRADWVEAVKQCKTLARLASLCAAFCDDATKRLEQMQVDRDNLLAALTTWEREVKARKSLSKSKTAPSEVWANVKITEEICMARGDDFTWWPARKCLAKEEGLAESLETVDRCLVALFGEMGALRVVKMTDILPFDGEVPNREEEEAPLSKEVRGQLDDCMAMARRVLRSQKKGK
eukprot:scaffold10856_cov229-Amphora_coffeaeformis.AAC.12